MKAFCMTREGGLLKIVFALDPEDSHFCIIQVVRKKSNVQVCSHYVLRSDIPVWVSSYESDKYKIVET